ncbi:kynureninase [Larkinella punicea]|uniref:Kynureninase n=1 Tax=Larkinella punicea TaxID=2315727 RepID=A0A368JQ86_9BACT|nr:kynureninase [Larkinella punicea]RCR69837.1 kynureninase [Larkinella punicea]
MLFENSLAFARQLDQADPLRSYRDRFYIPERNGKPLIYFCGNSLGLQPKTARQALDCELAIWQQHGVEGWFEGENPWLTIHQRCKEPLAQIVGANPSEVCPMNNLTVNLHLLLTSFYQPTGNRTKILTIGGDFPSDQYALETHIQTRGLNPADTLVEVFPRTHEHTWQTADILDAVEQYRDSLALVLMSGLHYYTGQVFDMAAIAQKARQIGVPIGFDLAHAVGNIPLKLHDWGVDFAFWCSYKYLNSGPGGVSGIFVHENHHAAALPRLAGWWGYDEARRFEMTKGFVPMPGADGWQLSTPTVLAMAVHHAALQLTAEAGLDALRRKSELLTGFLEFVLRETAGLQIITPINAAERGCQLSLLIDHDGKTVFNRLTEQGVIGDWREPDCIRLAPTPLYNTFEEVWRVGQAFASC